MCSSLTEELVGEILLRLHLESTRAVALVLPLHVERVDEFAPRNLVGHVEGNAALM